LNSNEDKKKEISDIVKITRDADKIQNLEYIIFNPNDVIYSKYELNDTFDTKNLNNFIN